jgi:hypothetical protein
MFKELYYRKQELPQSIAEWIKNNKEENTHNNLLNKIIYEKKKISWGNEIKFYAYFVWPIVMFFEELFGTSFKKWIPSCIKNRLKGDDDYNTLK